MLPVSVGFATVAAATSAVTVASVQAMPDCEQHRHQHQAPSKQTQKSDQHSACVVGCALCFGFVWNDANTVAYLVTPSAALMPVLVQSDIPSLMGLPPFRPPRA